MRQVECLASQQAERLGIFTGTLTAQFAQEQKRDVTVDADLDLSVTVTIPLMSRESNRIKLYRSMHLSHDLNRFALFRNFWIVS